MIVNFLGALAEINKNGRNRVLQFARDARPPAAYLFAQYLPEVPRATYNAQTATMTIRATMAGMVGMDSPYPEGGAIELGTFDEQTTKLAIRQRFPEQQLRELQAFVAQLQLNGGNTNEALVNAVVNFLDKLLIQPHLDRTEWLRGQALANGAIDWTFGPRELKINYGFPVEHLPATRTGANGYGSTTTSKWWDDYRMARRRLKGNIREIVMHPDTADMIMYNPANSLEVIAMADNTYTVRRIVGSTERSSTDARDTVRFRTYGAEAEILDLDAAGKTKNVPFLAPGDILFIGNNTGTRFEIGAGATTPVENALGYTHIAPTVEGQGAPGRWADIRVPDDEPWSLEGRSASNVLPVIEGNEKVVRLRTEMV